MAQRFQLRTLQQSEFRSPQNELIINAIVPASELIDRRSLRFGFAPNLRVPKKSGSVINGIVSRIESEKGLHIDSPVRISCRSSQVGSQAIEIFLDPEIDGIMDGGHRCRALEVASVKGLSLEHVTVQLQIFSGLDQQSLRNKAIQSNTSRSVTARSRQYFSGVYDELIEAIDMSKYPACFWRDGEAPDATGIFCQGIHIISLLSWISPDMYDRSGYGGQSPHTRAKSPGIGNEKNTLSITAIQKVAHLFDDVFLMEKMLTSSPA